MNERYENKYYDTQAVFDTVTGDTIRFSAHGNGADIAAATMYILNQMKNMIDETKEPAND